LEILQLLVLVPLFYSNLQPEAGCPIREAGGIYPGERKDRSQQIIVDTPIMESPTLIPDSVDFYP
jgi:hypothetical protein